MNKNLKNKIEESLNNSEMVMTQLQGFELLKLKELKQATVDRKIKDVGLFYLHLRNLRSKGVKVDINSISNIAYEYVHDGYFNDKDSNFGTKQYRRSIYSNIREGINFVYRDYFGKEDVVSKLTNEQIEELDTVDKNNWFRIKTDKSGNVTDVEVDIQEKILNRLGLKVYFDENNKPYVLSHETAKILGIENYKMMSKIRNILSDFTSLKNLSLVKSLDFTMVEDSYTSETHNKGYKKNTTFRLSKDLIINYVLGLNSKKYTKFKFEYQSAFNLIEEEFKKVLKENAKLKKSFLEMYNKVLLRNRELLSNQIKKKIK